MEKAIIAGMMSATVSIEGAPRSAISNYKPTFKE
jgi:hypothetical protein